MDTENLDSIAVAFEDVLSVLLFFNQDKLNWLPYRRWLNHVMQPESPLSNGKLDEEPYDFEYYGRSTVMILMVLLHWTIIS